MKPNTDALRGTGRTTRQLHALPKGCIFIWCNNNTGHPRDLVEKIGRPDIKVLSLNRITDRNFFLGRAGDSVDIDHEVDREAPNLVEAVMFLRASRVLRALV